ncbi:hypothetical protein [Streptomyces sp. NRRL WC-3742]|uniref:hypothetical protein n=1 Tax=Streptomyces sp. NRRL WC-3742 TaxID=1463934 RepID=UPI00068FA3F2|nr:hypothetical protein [Streptomyces sp. NRRL WC-3742]
MSYGYIARGPMAADQFEARFTRIANQLFRDPRISFKAKGIFGLISTHKDGFGLSLESIAASSTDGISAVRTGLKELERYRYLVRERERNDAGHLQQTRYWITDMPDGLVITLSPDPGHGQDPSSAPACENCTLDTGAQTPSSDPECGFPQVDDPPVDDHPHKKTNIKKTISLPRPTGPAQAPDGPVVERENPAPPTGTDPATEVAAAWITVRERLGRPVPPLAGAKIAAAAAALLAQGLEAAVLTAAAADMATRDGWSDLARHLEHFTPAPAVPAQRTTAAWCGSCNNGHPPASAAERMRETPDGRVVRCPACHPAAASS